MGRVRSGLVLGILALAVALIAAQGASARHVQMHVNIKDQGGYQMSIEASRDAGHVIQIASDKIEGPNTSAPIRALSRRHAAQAARKLRTAESSKTSDAKPRTTSGFISIQVHNNHAVSTYGVQGTVTHNRLFGRLGDFGRVSLHFHLRHKRTVQHGCIREHERLGVFKGRVRFRGEDHYVNVKASELRGKVETQGRRAGRCRSIVVAVSPGHGHETGRAAKPGGRGHVDRYTLFFADKASRYGSRFFAAIKETRDDAAYLTDSFEFRGSVFIDREEYGEGKARDFRVAKSGNAARIKPSPRAYRGVGHFRSRKKHNHWKGSLVTSMPGAPHFRLAGKNWKPALKQYGRGR